MPGWHHATAKWQAEGKLQLLGVTQEQHADRCQLFAQWKQLGWPILHDPINVLESTAVPLVVAIDEHGIVRAVRPAMESIGASFIDRTFADEAPGVPPRKTPRLASKSGQPDTALLRAAAEAAGSASAYRALADALALWGGAAQIDEAITAYLAALKLEPQQATTRFRLGVCYRLRYDSDRRQPGDFQTAVDAWNAALKLDPNQYIWRRRIQQYGPRLEKPYAFYDWVDLATREVAARGETPVALRAALVGAEIASPTKQFVEEAGEAASPDLEGKVRRDTRRLVVAEVTVIPARVKPGQSLRVIVTFLVNSKLQAHWNNEAEPLRLWIDPPEGWQATRRLRLAPGAPTAESTETRTLDFELKAPLTASGRARFVAYALYNVCENVNGVCQFLRQDLVVEVVVEP